MLTILYHSRTRRQFRFETYVAYDKIYYIYDLCNNNLYFVYYSSYDKQSLVLVHIYLSGKVTKEFCTIFVVHLSYNEI